MTTLDEMEAEFRENGLDELADKLRDYGPGAAFDWLINVEIPNQRAEDRLYHHGEGWALGNLEVARDCLVPWVTR